MRLCAPLVVLLVLTACDRERPPRVPPAEGGVVPLRDGGPIVRLDAGPRMDAGPNDAGRPADAGMPRDAGDAGPDAGDAGPAIVIDGIIDAEEWAGAIVETDSRAPLGAYVGNTLSALYAIRDDTSLYIAIAGTLTSGNAFLAYVDRDVNGTDGITAGLFDDGSGILDVALSKTTLTFGELILDAAWGTTELDRVATPTDDRMGWRDISTNPNAFARLTGASACGASECEAQISLTELGSAPTDTIAVFVRLGSATLMDDLSNQTLPMDDPDAFMVSVSVELPPP